MISGAMNFFDAEGKIYFQPALEGTFMEMQTREKTVVTPDSIAPLQFLKLYNFPKAKIPFYKKVCFYT